jgi:hypothetical protein
MQESSNYLEIAYFISGIILAVAAIAALYQIKVAKNTIKKRGSFFICYTMPIL